MRISITINAYIVSFRNMYLLSILRRVLYCCFMNFVCYPLRIGVFVRACMRACVLSATLFVFYIGGGAFCLAYNPYCSIIH